MLQMVPMPVAEMELTPGPRVKMLVSDQNSSQNVYKNIPKYSTIAPVPPLTVRIPATFRIMSACVISLCIFQYTENTLRTLGTGPSGKLTGKLNTNDLRCLELPGETSHDIDGISTTNTNSGHTETTGVGGVRVSTDHKTTGESVVLHDNLVDDTRAGLPETNVVLGARGGKEVVNLLVDVLSSCKILLTTNLGLNQVVTVDGGGGSDRGHTCRHELQNGHLGGGILASNAVRAELEIRGTTLNLLSVGVVKMRVENLLGIGQGTVKTLADDGKVFVHLGVVEVVALLPVGHLDLSGEGSIVDSGKGAAAELLQGSVELSR